MALDEAARRAVMSWSVHVVVHAHLHGPRLSRCTFIPPCRAVFPPCTAFDICPIELPVQVLGANRPDGGTTAAARSVTQRRPRDGARPHTEEPHRCGRTTDRLDNAGGVGAPMACQMDMHDVQRCSLTAEMPSRLIDRPHVCRCDGQPHPAVVASGPGACESKSRPAEAVRVNVALTGDEHLERGTMI
ncbi:hypothetical protein CMUS01_10444 [Colletotrichum musicola]|uniref:Uncharacterized protein n=1 Tax=Colletotrichum musicola TaxID=2175873 RepID=A0A8H6K2N9_9PEZI|nr:hypothetical protein CMUS01_10444 [Colletotrichum musicola]